MNTTQIILIVGFISVGVVLYVGLDNLAKNQPKSDFEACMDSLDGQKFKGYDDNQANLAKAMLCRGHE